MSDWPDRLDRFIEALRMGRRPESGLARTPEERDELLMAARLAGVRPGFDEPDSAFLERLRAQLGAAARPPESRLSRGRLVRAAGLLVAGIAGGIGLDRLVQRLQSPAPRAIPRQITLSGGRWYPVAEFADLPPGIARSVTAGAVPAFVLREGDTVRAISRVCTHMGCLLNFDAGESEIRCPCHGAVFDLTGMPATDYARRSLAPLPALDVRVVNGTVFVLGA